MEELSASEFARLTTKEKRSYLVELLGEESNSAENNFVSDSDDEEWFPGEQAMSSEMSDHEEDQENSFKAESELEAESENEIDEETNTENEEISAHQSLESTADFVAKDKTIWAQTPTVQRQHAVRNILRQRSGPHKDTETLSIADTFKVIFTVEMVDIIVRHTNRKASQVQRSESDEKTALMKRHHEPRIVRIFGDFDQLQSKRPCTLDAMSNIQQEYCFNSGTVTWFFNEFLQAYIMNKTDHRASFCYAG